MNVDINNDTAFKTACEAFAAVMVSLKRQGKGKIVHKQPLTTEDFTKLYSSDALDLNTPNGLQNKVFIDLMIHLCNRGRENLRDMKRSDFNICNDSNNNRHVVMNDMLTKNHRGDSRDGNSQEGRMYAIPDYELCPVYSFEKYIDKLNTDVDYFWQQPNDPKKNTAWYYKIPLGKNTLGDKMKNFSVLANLSSNYTNHCLRATCITTLDQSGFEARQIMAVSGQKSETSIRSYSHHASEQKKREMSLALTTHMTGFISNVVNSEPKHFATISLPQSNKSSERQQLSDITNVPHEGKVNHFNFYNCTVNINN